MTRPSLRSLSASLGLHLRPAPGVEVPDVPVTAVHISELAHPEQYLSGGELLLTTGVVLSDHPAWCQAYVDRLRVAGVAGIGFGLGPVFDQLPRHLVEACRTAGLPLLVVPPPTPFLTVSRAYWTAIARSGEQHLLDLLAAQRALIDAASAADPVTAIVRTLATWLDGWVAILSREGDVERVHPPAGRPEAQGLRDDVRRLGAASAPAAAAVASGRRHVALFPLTADAVRGGDRGYLAVGAAQPMEVGTRRIVFAAAELIALVAPRPASGPAEETVLGGAIAALLAAGDPSAAALLAGDSRFRAPGSEVRVLVARSAMSEAILDALTDAEGPVLGRRDGAAALWLVLPAAADAVSAVRERLLAVDPAAALVSAPVRAEAVGATRRRLLDELDDPDHPDTVGAGEIRVETPHRLAAAATSASEQLGAGPEELRVAVEAFLRHHGQLESAARSLGVHRNTLRHRMTRVRDLVPLDLDDPDVRAHLWLALRSGRR